MSLKLGGHAEDDEGREENRTPEVEVKRLFGTWTEYCSRKEEGREMTRASN